MNDLRKFFNKHIQLFDEDEIAADIWIGNSKEQFKIKKYNNEYERQLFFANENEITFDTFILIAVARITSDNNVFAEEIAEEIKDDNYDVYDLLKKTHGMNYFDYLWFKFDDENITYNDVRYEIY